MPHRSHRLSPVILLLQPHVGTDGDDSAYGGDGNDTFQGLGGNDLLVGNAGDDWLFGGDGADVLAGWAGTDVMDGGDGNDTFLPGSGNDTGYGGAGQDYFTAVFVPERSHFYWDGGADDDLFVLNDMTDGTVIGGDGAADVLQLDWRDTRLIGVTFTPEAASREDLSVTLSGIELFRITTGSGSDRVTTAEGDDLLTLDWGANVARAMGGNDAVSYRLGLANDLDGGAGTDTLTLMQVPWGWDIAFDASGAEVLDGYGSRLIGFENFVVIGLGGADSARLGTGADIFSGKDGNDSGWGGIGNDSLRGGTGEDVLLGEAGDDRLRDGSGNDQLFGGEDRDWLFFGQGTDSASGGAGADRFYITLPDDQPDLIADFTSGEDRLFFWSGQLGADLAPGKLAPGGFAYDQAAADHGQFVYRSSGELIWDANGAAPGGERILLVLQDAPALVAQDIYLIG